jgi:sugar phosphate isomerase/epimerase
MRTHTQSKPIALQLYSVRKLAEADLIETLRSVAELGYSGVEFAGYHGVPIKDIRGALDQYGLKAVGSHVPYARFDTEIGVVLQELNELGCTHAQVPWLAPEQRPTTVEDATALAVNLNVWGARAKKGDVRLGYHNHDFEFKEAGNQTVFDLLVEMTDPSVVDFELDLGWVHFAGLDPEAKMREISGRIPLVHVKDIAAGSKFEAVPIGEGILDWNALLATAKTCGAEWFIVEQDNPADPIAEVGRSFTNLEALLS